MGYHNPISLIQLLPILYVGICNHSVPASFQSCALIRIKKCSGKMEEVTFEVKMVRGKYFRYLRYSAKYLGRYFHRLCK